MKLRKQFLVVISALAIMGATFGSASADEGVIRDSEYDFERLLLATNTVESGMQTIVEGANKVLGPGFIPEQYARTDAECLFDSIMHFSEDASGGNPDIKLAIANIAMNRDLQAVLFDNNEHPGGILRYADFIKANSERVFGVSESELTEAFNASGAFADKYGQKPWALIDEIPSCLLSTEQTRALFPERNFTRDNFESQLNIGMARQRITYDAGVTEKDILAIARSPEPRLACMKILPNYIEAKGIETTESNLAVCARIIVAARATQKGEQPIVAAIAERLALIEMYMTANRKTAKKDDAFHYLHDKLENLGWPQMHYLQAMTVLEKKSVPKMCYGPSVDALATLEPV